MPGPQPTFASGRHIATARAAAGLSQSELATASGLHRSSLKYWEAHDRITENGHALDRIKAALEARGVTVAFNPPSVTLQR